MSNDIERNTTQNEENNQEEQEVKTLTDTQNVLPIEEDYDLIKNDPNAMWFKYEEKIMKITKGLGYWKNFDQMDLYQQAYMYFIDLCKIYNPYYNDGFIPFDKFLFKNLIIKLRAYIQSYYFKRKREQPTEFSEYLLGSGKNTINEKEDKMYTEFIYGLISDRQSQILELSMKGFKQQEIGEMLDISQSRVSVIKKKTLKKLKDTVENKGY